MVSEVVQLPLLARVPHAPPSLLGLANLRGQVAPVASLRALVGAEPAQEETQGYALVLSGAAPVAIAIGKAPALVSAEAIQTDTIAARAGELLLGAFALESGEVAYILDIEPALARGFTMSARAPRDDRAPGLGLRREAGGNEEAEGAKLISFLVGGQEFALELDAVREIIAAPDAVAAMPGSEALVLGVASYRQMLLPLLSLRALLGFDEDAVGESAKVLVSHVAGGLIGLVADLRARSCMSAKVRPIRRLRSSRRAPAVNPRSKRFIAARAASV